MKAPTPALAAVNGVPLCEAGEHLDEAGLRGRAHLELLRQAAQAAGLLAWDDLPPRRGVPTEAASLAIEALVERELVPADADEDACRRLYGANPQAFATGERVRLRHILFAVTPGVPVPRLRQRAEACLIELRTRAREEPADRFAAAARELSNCPSGADGGALGWLAATDCAPEFAREIFGHREVGVLPRLVHSRFGLHVVEVLAREAGTVPPFDAVRGEIAARLARQTWAAAVRALLERLAAAARVEGVTLDVAPPLVH